MFFDNELMTEYKKIIQDGHGDNFTKLYCLSCVDASLQWLQKEEITSDEEKLKMAAVVYDEWLDSDIQISQISDLICLHWDKYCGDDDFNLYDAMDGLYDEEEATDED